MRKTLSDNATLALIVVGGLAVVFAPLWAPALICGVIGR